MSSRAARRDTQGRYEVAHHHSPVAIYPEESHETIQICVPLDRARYRVDRQSATGRRLVHDLGSRDILVVPSGQPHTVEWQRPAGVVTLYLTQGFLDETAGRPLPELADALTLRDPFVSSAAAQLGASFTAAEEVGSAFTEALVTIIAYRVGTCGDRSGGIRLVAPVAPLQASQLARIEHYIDEHLDHDISLSQLAALLGLTVWHFTRRFAASQGITPYDYITRRRFEVATRLLRETNLSITEIALEIGLSHSHFSRSFLARHGASPREYRAQTRGVLTFVTRPPHKGSR